MRHVVTRFAVVLMALFGLFAALSVQAQVAGEKKVRIEATITLGGDTMATSRITALAGEQFVIQEGREGTQRVTLNGVSVPLNGLTVATDFTLELEQWRKVGTDIRRVTQVVRTKLGEALLIGGIMDADGKELRLVMTVSLADQ